MLPLLGGICIVLVLSLFFLISKMRQERQAQASVLEALQLETAPLKKIAQQYEHTKATLDDVMEISEDGVMITDIGDRIVHVNKKTVEILKTELISLKDRLITEILPIDLMQDKIALSFVAKVQVATGEQLSIKIKSMPMLKGGKQEGTLYLIYDLSKEKELEEMRFDFVSLIAHQLRTPLTTLKGYLYVLSQTIMPRLTPDEQQMLQRANSGGDRLGYLVENLLKTATVSEGQLQPQLKPTQIANLIQENIYELSRIAVQKGITITFVPPRVLLPQVPLDPYLISTVVGNLLMNAIEHTITHGQIYVSTEVTNTELVVNIQDQGEGIPSGAMPYLFTKFYKVPNNLIQTSSGSGLGLYFSKVIIDAHRGKIWVNSLLGHGATFSFSLPLR